MAKIIRWIILVQCAVFCSLQWRLWQGESSLPMVWQRGEEIKQLQTQNQQDLADNEALLNALHEFQSGLDAVETMARLELGLVKPDEHFVVLSEHQIQNP